MPIETPHHVIPDLATPAPAPVQAGQEAAANTTIQAPVQAAATTVQQAASHAPGHALLLLFIAALLAASLLLVLTSTRPRPPRAEPEYTMGGEWEPRTSYRYPGLRARIRRAYTLLRSGAEEALGRSLKWATPFELARLLGSRAAEGFARLYSRTMYSRHTPGAEEAGRAEELAREALRECGGRRG